MLAEAFLYARARLCGQHNPHGHLTELVGIWARHRRQRQAWAEHLVRARALCLRAAEACPRERRRTALVFGAGLLLDVPLEELARLFRRVVLADLAFLPATLRLARSLGNVELREADLTGCLDALPDPEALAAGALAPTPDLSLGLSHLDFACSANLLSQLPLFALAALAAREPQPEKEMLRAYAGSLVRAHLAALARLDCPACLVTDTRERGLDHGSLRHEIDLLHGVAELPPGETWIWRLAPRGEHFPDLDVEHEVLGAPDAHAAPVPLPPLPAPAGGGHA